MQGKIYIVTYTFINVKSISGRILEKLETVAASEEENLFFIVFPFVTRIVGHLHVLPLKKQKSILKIASHFKNILHVS